MEPPIRTGGNGASEQRQIRSHIMGRQGVMRKMGVPAANGGREMGAPMAASVW
jgi:hypothetical protein